MYLMYVDESGDPGTVGSNTNYFVLSALVIHESQWHHVLDSLIDFRRTIKTRYGLRMKDEIHAYDFISGTPNLIQAMPRNIRLDLLKNCLRWLSIMNEISIVTIRCDKSRGGDIFDFTWRALIQRFENTLLHGNFPGAFGSDKGLLLSDDTDSKKLTRLLREMRRYNQVPNMISFGTGSRNMLLRSVVEDPVFRDSSRSYLHQMADVVAYFGRQYYQPNNFIRKKGARTFYNILNPVTNRFVSRAATPNNVVEV